MDLGLIIFDCDGTLVDSEIIHNTVVADIMTGMGYPQFDLAYTLAHFAGKGMKDVVESIERDIGEKLPGSFLPDYTRMVGMEMERSLKTLAGVHDVLPLCHERFEICVASNGERPNVLTALKATKLDPYFADDRIFTPEMVAHPKPAPDMFLLAAERMSVRPAQTVVIEDSVTGVRAGKAAGMTVIGITAAYHDKDDHAAALRAAGAKEIIGEFGHLSRLIGL